MRTCAQLSVANLLRYRYRLTKVSIKTSVEAYETARRDDRHCDAAKREKVVPDHLRLLFEPVAVETASRASARRSSDRRDAASAEGRSGRRAAPARHASFRG